MNLKAIFRQSFGIRQYYKSFRLYPELLGLQATGHMTLAYKALGVIGSWGRLGSYFVWMLFNYDLGVQNHVFSSPLQPVLFILEGCWCSFLLLYCYFNFICSSSKRIKFLIPFLWWLMCTNYFTFESSRQISPFERGRSGAQESQRAPLSVSSWCKEERWNQVRKPASILIVPQWKPCCPTHCINYSNGLNNQTRQRSERKH